MAKEVATSEVTGWILVAKDDDQEEWHIAWLDIFGRKKDALAFAAEHRWSAPYRAVRGRLKTDELL